MSEARKRIVGIDLGIDPDYLEEVVRQTVSAGIAEALGGKDAVASEIIHSVLNQKINKHGELVTEGMSAYNREGAVPIIEYYTTKIVRQCAKEMVAEIIEERRDEIKAAIKKAMKEQRFFENAAEVFMAKALNDARSDWGMKISMQIDGSDL